MPSIPWPLQPRSLPPRWWQRPWALIQRRARTGSTGKCEPRSTSVEGIFAAVIMSYMVFTTAHLSFTEAHLIREVPPEVLIHASRASVPPMMRLDILPSLYVNCATEISRDPTSVPKLPLSHTESMALQGDSGTAQFVFGWRA